MMTARDIESAMIERCVAVARNSTESAQDQREANVFQLAASVINSRFPQESKRLMDASEQYFSIHPTDKVEPGEVVRKNWIINLPRLRDMLSYKLGWHDKQCVESMKQSSDVLLSDLPEDEREPFLKHLAEWGHTLPEPVPLPGDPPYNIRAYRCDYIAWKLGKPEMG